MDRIHRRLAMHPLGRVVIEHPPDGMLDAVGRVAHRMPDPRRDRIREQRRSDAHRGDRERQPPASLDDL
jgi:hypothetical protein